MKKGKARIEAKLLLADKICSISWEIQKTLPLTSNLDYFMVSRKLLTELVQASIDYKILRAEGENQ